jgi:hypothetical protein
MKSITQLPIFKATECKDYLYTELEHITLHY